MKSRFLTEGQPQPVAPRKRRKLLATTAATARRNARNRGESFEGDAPLDPAKLEAEVRALLANPDTAKAGMDGDEFEDMVFVCADKFTASVFVGMGKHQTEEFTDPLAAMDRAAEMKWNGRQGIAYALSPKGRQVCLARDEWPRYRAMWAIKLRIQQEK